MLSTWGLTVGRWGVYYNEIDEFQVEGLRARIKAGLLPDGEVDQRSIVDVRPDDLRGFSACHFFAGIGGWPLAGRLAGLPDDHRWWSGSCPCPPFSVAGKGMKTRRVEPGLALLAHGLPAGMGKLPPDLRRLAEMAGLDGASLRRAKRHRIGAVAGYGNAIVPQVAAVFIKAVM